MECLSCKHTTYLK